MLQRGVISIWQLQNRSEISCYCYFPALGSVSTRLFSVYVYRQKMAYLLTWHNNSHT